jgi:hypothetical protein
MTTQEHALMIAMFAKQMQNTKVLLQIMRSRDLITAEDEKAFQALVIQDKASTEALMRDAAELYWAVAKKMGIGVPTDIPKLP